MEVRRLEPQITDNQLRYFMSYCLVVDSILIIMSVEQFYRNGEYMQLAVSTAIFVFMVLLIRRFNNG